MMQIKDSVPYQKYGMIAIGSVLTEKCGELVMKWEQYEKQMPIKPEEWQYKTQVNVECPKCGKKIWRRNDIVLASYPAKYQYECECGWIGYSHI